MQQDDVMHDWYLYHHKDRPDIIYWARRTSDPDEVEIRSPLPVAADVENYNGLSGPRTSARSGKWPMDGFLWYYRRVDTSEGGDKCSGST